MKLLRYPMKIVIINSSYFDYALNHVSAEDRTQIIEIDNTDLMWMT